MPKGTQPCLESERLKLRPYCLNDSKNIQLLAGDERVARETMNIPYPYKDGVAEKWISSLDEKWIRRERIEYAIIEKEISKFVGGMSFVEIKGNEAEIGYWIGVPYWNNGYCTEAGKLLMNFGFSALSLNKVSGRHLSSNPRSGKVLEKLGLVWKECEYQNDRNGENVKFEFYETPSI